MSELIELSAIKNPVLAVKIDGVAKEFDVWSTMEALEVEYGKLGPNPTLIENFDAARKAFGFPTSAESRAQNKPTITQQACQVLRAKLQEIVEGDESSKKLLATSQK